MAYGKFTCICLPKLKQIYESKWIISPGRVENKQQLANHHLVLQIISSILHGHLKIPLKHLPVHLKKNMVHPKSSKGERSIYGILFQATSVYWDLCRCRTRPGECRAASNGMGFYFRQGGYYLHGDFQNCKPFFDTKLPAFFG